MKLDEPQPVTFPEAARVRVDGRPQRARARRASGALPAGAVELPAGTAVPVAEGIDAQRGEQWARPVSDARRRLAACSSTRCSIATFLGTMGLPHILVRFYTNPDGPAARRTTVRVLGLLGALLRCSRAVYGRSGARSSPELYLTGETDSVVLRLPEAAWPGLGGELLGALVAAGAFAAFMSTASGLLVSLAGTVSYDLWRRGAGAARRRGGGASASPRSARWSLPIALALVARELDISVLVGWAFALAASTFCPLLLLGIWWERPDRARRGGRAGGRRDGGDRGDLPRAC